MRRGRQVDRQAVAYHFTDISYNDNIWVGFHPVVISLSGRILFDWSLIIIVHNLLYWIVKSNFALHCFKTDIESYKEYNMRVKF